MTDDDVVIGVGLGGFHDEFPEPEALFSYASLVPPIQMSRGSRGFGFTPTPSSL